METFRGGLEQATGIHGEISDDRGRKKPLSVPGVTVTDNFDVLKNTGVRQRGRQLKINSLLNRHKVSMEAASQGLSPEDIDALYNKRGQQPAQHTQVLPTQEYMNRPSKGHPLVMKLPVESVTRSTCLVSPKSTSGTL